MANLDVNQLAARIVEQATNPSVEEMSTSDISSLMREMGRRGGIKGGKARAAKLTDTQRREIASNAARKRWEKKG